MIRQQLRAAIVILGAFTVITGILFPLVLLEVTQQLFPIQANGSLIIQRGNIIGSELIGQNFDSDPRYFWGRLSATSSDEYSPYNADAPNGPFGSSGSNYGPLNPALVASGNDTDARGMPIPPGSVQARINALNAANSAAGVTVTNHPPIDLVTASGSGLDPDISPASANYQIPRIAKLRGIAESSLQDLVNKSVEEPTFGALGEPRVNVLKLNLALDSIPNQLLVPTPASTVP